MELEKALVMAVAAIAEENNIKPKHVIVHSFKEIEKSSLEKYLEDHRIKYHKFQLEDAVNE